MGTKVKKVPHNSGAGRRRPLSVGDVREAFGLSRRHFSRLTGFSERAIASWEGGKVLSDSSRQRMVEMQRLQKALARVMDPEFIAEWLQTPNQELDNLKPLEVVERGEIDRLWRLIYYLESGTPG